MLLEPLDTISWAYQLHYYLCFRTRRAAAVFTAPERVEALEAALREICERHQYHLLQLWQASAYAGTTGKVTTALVKAFLSEREEAGL